ncbi:MAG: exodeoxyribonuclease VII large subunit [Maritimibacter sp.]
MSLFEDPDTPQNASNATNAPEFTVSELSGAVKRMVEGEFGHVRVRAELGRVSRPRSGHIYLDLKDDRSVLAGVIWKGVASRLATQPEEGMEVIATGRLTTFPGQSKYQMVVEDIAPAGMGALMAMLEKRKAMLAGEGLFAPERKRPIPFLPEVIGVVTSPSGAVIRDILHRLRDRFPRKVLIWPAAVQGERCAPEIVRGIEGFNAMQPGGVLPRPDLIIVARGGGSLEDLWGFNDEAVVRAAAASAIPLISAVGHETDTTLIDFASDQRAPTPTAAAELAVPVRRELMAWAAEQEARLTQALTQGITRRGQRLADLSRALPRPQMLLEGPSQRLDRASDRLPAALTTLTRNGHLRLSRASAGLRPGVLVSRIERRADRLTSAGGRIAEARTRKAQDLQALTARFERAAGAQIRNWRDHLAALDRTRQTLGYTETLKRGYAVVRGDGAVVTTRAAAEQASALEVEFSDGKLTLGSGSTPPPATPASTKPAPKKAPSKAKPKPSEPDQGSLF